MYIKNINSIDFMFNINKNEGFKKINGSGASLVIEVQKERTKSEKIARKIVRGETLNEEELKYIKEKNPELLNKANETKNRIKNIKSEVKAAKTKDEINKILNRARANAIQLSVTKNVEISFQGKLELEEVNKLRNNLLTNNKRKKQRSLDKFV